MKSSDIFGRAIAEVFPKIPMINENAQRALAGEEFTSTVSIGDSYFEVFLGPFKTSRGKIQGITGVAVDITLQKTAQAQIDNYRYDMEKTKTLAAIGALSTEIANDMAGPLHESKVSLFKASNGLRGTIGAEEVREKIKNGIDRLSMAINKLDAFCDKANLKKPFEAQPIEIYSITQRLMSVFKETAQRAMMKISVKGAEIVPVMLISSREMEQLIYTMLQQRIQSAEGDHFCKLEIAFSTEGSFLCMKFSEHCPGHSPKVSERLIASASNGLLDENRYNFELSVLKGITEAYDGTIRIGPNDQGGLVYEIRIPVVA